MAVLGEIRKRGWLLMIFIGGALLLFLLGDGSLFGSKKSKDVIGKVDGASVKVDEFNSLLNLVSQNPQYQKMPKAELQNKVWDQLIISKAIEQKCDQLGIKVTQDKIISSLSENPQIASNPEFQENGAFSKTKFLQWLSELKQNAESGDEQARGQYKAWEANQVDFVKRLKSQTYTSLLLSGIQINDLESENYLKKIKETIEVDFVPLSYSDYLAENKIEITDKEAEDYIKSHEKQFYREESRNLGYVVFETAPSTADKKEALDQIKGYLTTRVEHDKENGIIDTIESFSSTKDEESYISSYSDGAFDARYKYADQIFSKEHQSLMGKSVGSLVGPYEIQGNYVISKLSDKKKVSDSVKVRHVLLGYKSAGTAERNKADAKAKADSLISLVKAGSSMVEIVEAHSDDPSKVQNQGEFWVSKDAQLVPEFKNYALRNDIGATGIVETQFGYHIIKVESKNTPKQAYQIVDLVKSISASEKTQDSVYTVATDFVKETKEKTFNDFINQARAKKYKYFTNDQVARFDGLTSIDSDLSSDVLKWAFDKKTKSGDSQMFTSSTRDYVLVYANGINPEGLATVAQVGAEVKNILANKKAVEAMKTKYSKYESLSQLAEETKQEVQNSKISMAFPFVNQKNEPQAAGTFYASEKDKLGFAKGGESLYAFVRVSDPEINPQIAKTPELNDVEKVKKSIQQAIVKMIGQSYANVLLETTDVEDYRAKILP